MAQSDQLKTVMGLQEMGNSSFDPTFGVKAVEMLGINNAGSALLRIPAYQGLQIPPHDYIALTYTGDNLTGVVYKTGGNGGNTEATLTLAYTGAVLDSITKS